MTNELIAALYYVSIGYLIYWPLTHQGPCDFIAVNKDDLVKVQVKSRYRMNRPNGKAYIQATVRRGGGKRKDRYYSKEECDVIAVVFEDHIWVFPIEAVEGLKTVNLFKGQETERKSRLDTLDVNPYQVK